MKLLTQEEGAQLRVGDVVNVYFFTPRKPKGEVEPPSRFHDGRQEWVSEVWRNKKVTKDAWETTQDGYAVALEGSAVPWLTNHMEKVL